MKFLQRIRECCILSILVKGISIHSLSINLFQTICGSNTSHTYLSDPNQSITSSGDSYRKCLYVWHSAYPLDPTLSIWDTLLVAVAPQQFCQADSSLFRLRVLAVRPAIRQHRKCFGSFPRNHQWIHLASTSFHLHTLGTFSSILPGPLILLSFRPKSQIGRQAVTTILRWSQDV